MDHSKKSILLLKGFKSHYEPEDWTEKKNHIIQWWKKDLKHSESTIIQYGGVVIEICLEYN
jgi:hypothetical protein